MAGSAEFRAEDEGFRAGVRDARAGRVRQRRPRWLRKKSLGGLWWNAYGRGYDEGRRERMGEFGRDVD